MTDPGLDPILAYLREHAGRYSLPALREQLVRSGYDPARVDEAVALHQQQDPPAPRSRVWPKALLVLGINAVLSLGVIRAQGFRSDASSVLSSLYMLLVGAELVGGFVACFPAKSRSWGLALLLGFAFTVALGILALGGFCLYILSKGMNH
jgi:FtsH-binding integral membrane protein